MSTDTYNGWTNYQTWNVALWMGNDEGLYRNMIEMARAEMDRNGQIDKAAARTIVHFLFPDSTPDLADDDNWFDKVDFLEIAAMIEESVA